MSLMHCLFRAGVAASLLPLLWTGAVVSADGQDHLEPEGTLSRPSARAVEQIRRSVALTGRNRLFVGEPSAGLVLKPEAGAVEYRTLASTGWSDPQSVGPRSLQSNDHFGFAVSAIDAVGLDGQVAVLIGAPGDDQSGAEAGAAYLCYYACAVEPPYVCGWLSAKWHSPGPQPGGGFGKAVDLDQDLAIVGAPHEGTGGRAHILSRSPSLFEYAAESSLAMTAPVAGDEFGTAVSVDGSYAVVGAPGRDGGGFTNIGAAVVFRRSFIMTPSGPQARWDRIATLQPPLDQNQNDIRFGECVWVEGEHLFVGAPWYGYTNSGWVRLGAVFVYRFHESAVEYCGRLTRPAGQAAAGNTGYQLAAAGDLLAVRTAASFWSMIDTWFHDNVELYRYDPDSRQWLFTDTRSITSVRLDAAEPAVFGGVAVNPQRLVADVPYDARMDLFKFCPGTDLNGDCAIDLLDLSLLTRDWLR